MKRNYKIAVSAAAFLFVLMTPMFQAHIMYQSFNTQLVESDAALPVVDDISNEFSLSESPMLNIFAHFGEEVTFVSGDYMELVWQVFGEYGLTEGLCEIYEDSSLVFSDIFHAGEPIAWPIDDLIVGVHEVIFVAYDDIGESDAHTTTVTVTSYDDPPLISDAPDVSFVVGSISTAVWYAEDENPGTYTITENGVPVVEDMPWTNGVPIEWSLTYLLPGTHTIICTVYDISGNSASDTINVDVLEGHPEIDVFSWNETEVVTNYGTADILRWSVVSPSFFEGVYSIYSQDGHIESGEWTQGVDVIFLLDSLPLGTHTVVFRAYQNPPDPEHFSSAITTVTVTSGDDEGPTWIIPPSDQYIEYGEVLDYSITASDTLGEVPGIDEWWIGDTDNFDLTYTNYEYESTAAIMSTGVLPVGDYFTYVDVSDRDGLILTGEFWVHVLESTTYPTISDAEDLTFVEGSDITAIWYAEDDNPATYTIIEDGEVAVDEAPWASGSPIEYPLDHLVAGSHEIICYVYDGDGHSASDTVRVVVGFVVGGPYPTVSGNPLFTLHILAVEGSALSIQRAEWFADNLRDIGIECLIYPLPFQIWLRSVIYPEDYGFPRPSSSGAPEWTTATRTPHFVHVGDGEGYMWCGANEGDPPCEVWGEEATPPGYGNNWDDILEKQFQLPAGEVSLSYSIQYDTELSYDIVHVEISTDGIDWDVLASFDGTSNEFEDYSLDISEYAGQDVYIRFHFISDGGVSDEDGFDTDGACRIDWIEVSGYQRDDFLTGTDGWLATSPEVPVIEGFDVAFMGMNPGGYIPGLDLFHTLLGSLLNQGYNNPEYKDLIDRLNELNIDWNANFPEPPDLSEEALDIFGQLQEIWVEDNPLWVLWGRDYWETGAETAGWSIALSNPNNEHLANEVVRKAISLAIDRQGMLDAGLATAPRTWNVQTPIHPMNPGFDAISYAEYDVERAKNLLASVGYADIQLPNYDYGSSVIEVFNEIGEPDGFAIAGTTINEKGDRDFLLIRTDLEGTQLWNYTFDWSQQNDIAFDLIQISQDRPYGGHFLLVGQSVSETGYSDVLAVVISSDGLWDLPFLYSIGQNEIGYSIIELGEGGFAIAASASDGPGSSGNWNGWLIITDENGYIIEDQSVVFGGPEADFAMDVIHVGTGFLVTGYTNSIGSGGADLWVVHLHPDADSPNGYVIAERAYGGPGFDYGFELVESAGVGIIIIGSTSSRGAGGFDAWMVAIDSWGRHMWNETYGGPGNDYGTSVVACEPSTPFSNGFAIGGQTFNPDTNSYDFWLVRTYVDGPVKWSATYGGLDADYCESIIQTTDNGFAMVGTTYHSGENEVLLVLVPPESLDTTPPNWIVEPSDITMEYYYDVNMFFDLCQVSDESGISSFTLNGDPQEKNYFTLYAIWDGPEWTFIIGPRANAPVGTYVFSLEATDFYGNTVSGEFEVVVQDTRAPEWVIEPENQFVEYGKLLSYEIRAWDPSHPYLFSISNTLYFTIDYDSDTGFCTLSSRGLLEPGTYPLQIYVVDPFSNHRSKVITVTVQDTTAPTIDQPSDIEMLENTDVTIIWNALDLNPGVYTITEDGNPIVEDVSWTSASPIEFSLKHLSTGTHEIICYIYDEFGNSISDSVTVTVEPFSNRDFGYSVIEVFDEFGEPDGLAIVGSTIDYYGNQDILLIRTDQNGNQLWNMTYGSDLLNEVAYDIVQTDDLGFVIVGSVCSETGFNDILVFRVDSSGTLLTEYWYEGLPERNEIGYAIIETGENSYAIAASTSDGPGSSGNWDGMFLLISMSHGPHRSYRIVTDYMMTFGGSQPDCVFDIVQLDSYFMLTGYTKSIGHGGTDLWFVRLNPDPNNPGSYSCYEVALGGSGDDFGFELVVCEAFGTRVAIAGSTSSKGSGGVDAWLVLTYTTGSMIWDETYGGPGDDYGISVVSCEPSTDISNGFALGGYTFNAETGSYDFWLIRSYVDGPMRWSEMYDGQGVDYLESIIQTSDNGFAMVGTTHCGFESKVMLVIVPPEPLDTDPPELISVTSVIVMEYYYDYRDHKYYDLARTYDEGGIYSVTLIGDPEDLSYFGLRIVMDGGTWEISIYQRRLAPTGYYYLTLNVTDFHGNSILFEFLTRVRDTIDPVWIWEPEDQFVEFGDPLSLLVVAEDASGILYISVNDTITFLVEINSQTPTRMSVTISSPEILQPGTYGLMISVRDKNYRLLRKAITITVQDTTPPTLEVTDQFVEFGDSFRYDLSTSDMSLVYWTLNDESGKFLMTSSYLHASIRNREILPIGVYTLEVQVRDQYDNTVTASFTVTVQDTIGPTSSDLLDNYYITYTSTVQIVLEIVIEDNSLIQYIYTTMYNPYGNQDGFSIVMKNSSDGKSCTLTVFSLASLQKGYYDLHIDARDIHGNYASMSTRIHVYYLLHIELSGEFDYKLKEDIQMTISAYITNAGNNLPVYAGYSVLILSIYDSNGNRKNVQPSTFEYINRGMWLWTSQKTVDEMMSEGTLEVGIYTIEVQAYGSQGSYFNAGYAYISIHIDPPGASNSDTPLDPGWVSFSGLAIANLAIVVVFLLKRKGKWRSH
jgi:hypothetical protein